MVKEFQGNRSRVPAIVAAGLVTAAVVTAFVIAPRSGTEVAGNDQAAAGSSGIARPHPPLDRAPGEPLNAPRREQAPL